MTTTPLIDSWMWHNSMLNTLKQCEAKFDFAYIQGLKPRQSSHPLNRGIWFHALMAGQGLKQGMAQDTLLVVPTTMDLGIDPLHEVEVSQGAQDDTPYLVGPDHSSYPLSAAGVHQMLIDHVHSYMPTGDEDTDGLPDECWSLYQRYIDAWGLHLMAEEVLAVEVTWQRTDEHTGMTYGGRIDRVTRRNDGLVVLRDHKTTGQTPSSDYRLTDSQLHLYAWGTAPWLHEHDIEIRAVEFDYIVTRPPGQVRLTKAGALYKNQALVDEWTLVRGLVEQGADPDDERFKEARQQMRGDGTPHFFRRHLVPVNETVVRTLLLENASARSRVDTLLNDELDPTRNVSSLHCGWCEFSQICTATLYGNDVTPLLDDFEERTIDTITTQNGEAAA